MSRWTADIEKKTKRYPTNLTDEDAPQWSDGASPLASSGDHATPIAYAAS